MSRFNFKVIEQGSGRIVLELSIVASELKEAFKKAAPWMAPGWVLVP